MSRKRLYVAGSYSADNVLDVLNNMRRGIVASKEFLLDGFSPFCPWLDYHFQLSLQSGKELTVNDYYEYSMSWLEASDAVFVLPDSDHSRGTQKEIARAVELGIPVFVTRKALQAWVESSNQKASPVDMDVHGVA